MSRRLSVTSARADIASTSFSPIRTRSGRRTRGHWPTCFRILLGDDALVVVETSNQVEPALPLDLVTTRRYGSARITVFSR